MTDFNLQFDQLDISSADQIQIYRELLRARGLPVKHIHIATGAWLKRNAKARRKKW